MESGMSNDPIFCDPRIEAVFNSDVSVSDTIRISNRMEILAEYKPYYNGGDRWFNIFFHLDSHYVGGITIAPNDERTFWGPRAMPRELWFDSFANQYSEIAEWLLWNQI